MLVPLGWLGSHLHAESLYLCLFGFAIISAATSRRPLAPAPPSHPGSPAFALSLPSEASRGFISALARPMIGQLLPTVMAAHIAARAGPHLGRAVSVGGFGGAGRKTVPHRRATLSFLVIMVLCCAAARAQITQCPAPCSCTDRVTDCSSKSLTAVPSGIDPATVSLYVPKSVLSASLPLSPWLTEMTACGWCLSPPRAGPARGCHRSLY